MFNSVFLSTVTNATENPYAVIPEDALGKFVYGLKISLFGIGMVFLILLLLMAILYLFKLVFHTLPNKKANVDSIPKQPAYVPAESHPGSNDDGEIIAVLAAAIAAYEGEDSATSRYRIRSFKRI